MHLKKFISNMNCKEINTFIHQGHISSIKSDSTDIYAVINYFKFVLWAYYPEKNQGFHKNIKQHNCFWHW